MCFWYLLLICVLVKCLENFNIGSRYYVVREIDFNNKTIDVISSNNSYRKACSCNETALLEDDALVCKQNIDVESIAKDKSCRLSEKLLEDVIWSSDFNNELNCTIVPGSFIIASPPTWQWSSFTDNSCLRFILNSWKNVCPNSTLAGKLYSLRFKCYVPGLILLNSSLCILFTLPGEVLEEKNVLQTAIPNGSWVPSSFFSNNLTTQPIIVNETNNNTYKLTTVVTEVTETLSELTSEKPNNTQHIKKSIMKNVLYIILGCFGVILILLGGLYAICQIVKRIRKHKNTLKSNGDKSMEELYAFPAKKKKLKFGSQTVKSEWAGYDQVGSVIPGTYEERKKSSETSLYPEIDDCSPKTLENCNKLSSSPILAMDAPYKTIVSRNSSFFLKRSRLAGDEKPEMVEATSTEGQHLLQSAEGILKDNRLEDDFNPLNKNKLDNDKNLSFFKPGGSTRIKQQRTSRRKCDDGKLIAPLRELVHEEVHITPPVSNYSSPDLNEAKFDVSDTIPRELNDSKNDNSKKRSPAVPQRTSSMKKTKQNSLYQATPKETSNIEFIEKPDAIEVKNLFQDNQRSEQCSEDLNFPDTEKVHLKNEELVEQLNNS